MNMYSLIQCCEYGGLKEWNSGIMVVCKDYVYTVLYE